MKKLFIVCLMLLVTVASYAATLTVTEISNVPVYHSTTGVDSLFTTPTTGDKYLNDDDTFLEVFSRGDSVCSMTITAQKTSFWSNLFGTQTISNITITFPIGDTTHAWVKAPMGTYNLNGYAVMSVTAAGRTSLKVHPFKFKR